MKKYIVAPEYNGYKMSEYLKEILGYSGRSMRKITIFLNGKKVTPNKKIRKLNRIIIKEKNRGTNILPMKMDLNIVYEDNNFIILNKPPFLIVHPTKKKVDITLANGIIHYMQQKTGEITIPRFYNRLDMNTSGIIVATKNGYAQAFLQNREKSRVKKFYKAIVYGIIEEGEFTIDKPIGRKGESLKRKIISVENGGKKSITKVKVIKTIKSQNLTFLEIELLTGRTHQIRVHLSSIGYPILGDMLYGGEIDRVKVGRQILHAYKIIFTNPETGNDKTVIAPIPMDMAELIKG